MLKNVPQAGDGCVHSQPVEQGFPAEGPQRQGEDEEREGDGHDPPVCFPQRVPGLDQVNPGQDKGDEPQADGNFEHVEQALTGHGCIFPNLPQVLNLREV